MKREVELVSQLSEPRRGVKREVELVSQLSGPRSWLVSCQGPGEL